MFLRRYVLPLLFILSTLTEATAQAGPAPAEGIGTIEGKVQDESTGAYLDYVAVKLLQAADSAIVNGGLTADGGSFRIAGIAPGNYLIQIEFMGYASKWAGPYAITRTNAQIQAGTLELTPVALELDAVEISATRSFVTQSIDKRAYDVQQLTTVQGGTALDVLNNIPSVSVDFEGAVSLRGTGNVNILINGKPSSLTQGNLASLQASDIESIEVITNPSSKYDPDGTGGIINIVLKKNRKGGAGGSITAGAGTRNKYNAGLQGFYQKGKLNLFGSYNFRYDNRFTRGESDRSVFTSSPTLRIVQENNGLRTGGSHAFQTSADYQFNKRNSLSFRSGYVTGVRKDEEVNQASEFLGEVLSTSFNRNSLEDELDVNIDLTAGYRHDFAQKGHMLTLDATWSRSLDRENQLLQNFYPSGGDFFEQLNERQEIVNPNPNENTTLQLDYVLPLKNKAVLEAGLKSIFRFNDNDFQAFKFDSLSGLMVVDPLLTNRFVYNDQIYSAYTTYSGELGKFSYKAGLRAEQTYLDFELQTTGETFENQFFNLFPSLFVGYKFNDEQQLVVNYGRRINRPGFRSLNPFPDLTNPFNIRSGNPNLQPEFVDSYELNYLRSFKNISINSGLYYRQTNNAFTRFITVDSLGIARLTEQNAATNRSYGWDNSVTGTIGEFWTFTANVNVFRNVIDAANLDSSLTNGAWVGLFRLNQTFRLPAGFQFQVNGYYNTPRNTPQGRFLAFTAVELGLRKKVLGDRGDLIFSLTDLFDTQQFQIEASDATFQQRFLRKRESQVGTVNFVYRFGKTEFGKKNNREGRRDDGGGGGMDMF